jgi:pimeloyl-ACP methyl ester carboxylesterase
VFPLELYEAAVRERLPRTMFTVLPGAAHVPMIDDPDLVARTILAVTGASEGQV